MLELIVYSLTTLLITVTTVTIYDDGDCGILQFTADSYAFSESVVPVKASNDDTFKSDTKNMDDSNEDNDLPF